MSTSHSKSWWSRSKSAKDVPMLRLQSSGSNLAQDARTQASYGSSKSKEHSAGSKFNLFVASAMGKKHKKPHLTIQDPPSPPTSYSTPASLRSTTSPSTVASAVYAPWHHPTARSGSTAQSYEYDIDQGSDYHTISEPRTPSDHPRDRRSYQNSLLTLSDPDPFAAGAIVVPRFDQDQNRLSVYSDSSLLDPHAKRGDFVSTNRMSYGSSSSNSHGNGEGQVRSQTLQPVSRMPSGGGSAEKRRNREVSVLPDSPISFDIPGQRYPDEYLGSRSRVISASGGNTMPVSGRDSQAGQSSSSQLRQRGMTIAGPGERVKRPIVATAITLPTGANRTALPRPALSRQDSSDYFSRSTSPTASSTAASPIMFSSTRSSLSTVSTATAQPPGTRPLVLVRKASSSRVNLPPLNTAPPSTKLPPPPLSPLSSSEPDEPIDSLDFPDVPSSTSSSVSFATMKFEMHSGDEILQLMRNGFADTPEDVDEYSHSLPNILQEPEPIPDCLPPSSYRLLPASSTSAHLVPPKSLKKAVSQQNMGRRQSEASVVSAASSSLDDIAKGGLQSSPNGKAPRKQRSFHHPRLPIPSLVPLRNPCPAPNSTQSHAEPAAPKPPPQNPTFPQYTRRRLFSGSSSRSTARKTSSSPPPTADDDIRSLLSLESKESSLPYSREHTPQKTRNKPLTVSFADMGGRLSLVTDNACIAPAWDEIGCYTTPATQQASTSDYVPQHIMSPADMLRLEEELTKEATQRESEERQQERDHKPLLELDPGEFGMSFVGRSTRPRTNSTLSNQSSASAATLAFGNGERPVEDSPARGAYPHTASTLSRRPATADMYTKLAEANSQRSPDRSTLTTRGTKLPPLSTRPSTAQPALRLSPPSSPTTYRSSPELPSTSLPPPPRPRPNREREKEQAPPAAAQDDTLFKRMSVAPFSPLSPPPRRRPTKPVIMDDNREEDSSSIRSSRPPSAFHSQKLLNRRSVMKKPSFLDFEDEIDHDEDDLTDATMGMQLSPVEMESSFLDLDRGKDSFDTIRSSGDNAYTT